MQRKAVFRHGSTANLEGNFTEGQTWVNSVPTAWKPAVCPSFSSQYPGTVNTDLENGEIHSSPEFTSDHGNTAPNMMESSSAQKNINTNNINLDTTGSFDSNYHSQQSVHSSPHILSSPQSSLTSVNSPFYSDFYSSQTTKRRRTLNGHSLSTASIIRTPVGSFEAVQEACLMRYFIEELSSWVS